MGRYTTDARRGFLPADPVTHLAVQYAHLVANDQPVPILHVLAQGTRQQVSDALGDMAARNFGGLLATRPIVLVNPAQLLQSEELMRDALLNDPTVSAIYKYGVQAGRQAGCRCRVDPQPAPDLTQEG